MEKWLISILTVSVAMSLLLRILPENSVKKTVHIAFGIIFLLVVTNPCIELFSKNARFDSINYFLENKISAIDENSDDKYAETVIMEYSGSLCEEAQKKIYAETGFICDIEVSVCDEIESDMFGKVLNVKCNVLKDNGTHLDESDHGIINDIPLVKDVVIEFNKKDNEEQIDTSGISDVLTEMFGINQNQCEIYIIGE